VFGLLIAPWPGWPRIHTWCLAKGATAIYGSFGSKALSALPGPSADGRAVTIRVGNREHVGSNHSGRAASLVFNGRLLAYFPAALAMALVLATDIDGRGGSGAGGVLLWVHVFIALLLGC